MDGQVVLPRISAKLFSGFTALTKVTNAANLNTAGVTSMVEMFVDDSALTAIVTYMPGDTIPVAKSITLTPLWVNELFTYNKNANDATGTDPISALTYDATGTSTSTSPTYTVTKETNSVTGTTQLHLHVSQPIPDVPYTRDGFTAAGWNTQADGSGTPREVLTSRGKTVFDSYAKALTNGQYSAPTTTGAPQTLYAQWATSVATLPLTGGTGTGWQIEQLGLLIFGLMLLVAGLTIVLHKRTLKKMEK